MATEPAPGAVLFDACVLYPAPLRDLLIQLATTGLFRAKWTEKIHEEWMTGVLRNRHDLSRQQLERTRSLMDRAVLDCLVEDYESDVPSIGLSDPDDAHVLAAAIHGGCTAIVTFNLRDFPATALSHHNIEALHPDDFVLRLCEVDRDAVLTAAAACRARLKNPPVSVEQYLAILGNQSLPRTAAVLAAARDLI